MTSLEPFLQGAKAPGLWSYQPNSIEDSVSDLDAFSIRRVALAGVADSQDLFDRLRLALRFPEWFGDNWDALADWSTEPDWLNKAAPTLVILTDVPAMPEPLATTFFELMESATRYWAQRGRIVYVMGDAAGSESDALRAAFRA